MHHNLFFVIFFLIVQYHVLLIFFLCELRNRDIKQNDNCAWEYNKRKHKRTTNENTLQIVIAKFWHFNTVCVYLFFCFLLRVHFFICISVQKKFKNFYSNISMFTLCFFHLTNKKDRYTLMPKKWIRKTWYCYFKHFFHELMFVYFNKTQTKHTKLNRCTQKLKNVIINVNK